MKQRESTFKQELVCLLPRLRRFGLSLSGAADVCDDLLQATCERALTRYHQWQPGTRLDSWAFAIMYSIWLNELRAQSIRRGAGFVDPDSTLFEKPTAEAKLYLKQVQHAVAALPEAQRVALLLVCVEGYGYREAAEILGIPVGTVMSRLARARLALVEQLDTVATKHVRIDG
jgi:RNA polymerase sigma-70 factor (ECF subfamily)